MDFSKGDVDVRVGRAVGGDVKWGAVPPAEVISSERALRISAASNESYGISIFSEEMSASYRITEAGQVENTHTATA